MEIIVSACWSSLITAIRSSPSGSNILVLHQDNMDWSQGDNTCYSHPLLWPKTRQTRWFAIFKSTQRSAFSTLFLPVEFFKRFSKPRRHHVYCRTNKWLSGFWNTIHNFTTDFPYSFTGSQLFPSAINLRRLSFQKTINQTYGCFPFAIGCPTLKATLSIWYSSTVLSYRKDTFLAQSSVSFI